MSLFASLQSSEPSLSDDEVAQALHQVKKTARVNRLVIVAPVLFVAAIAGAFVAAPPNYSDLLVTEAEASDDPHLPRVFGANGVWKFAEPISEQPVPATGPASMVEAPVDSLAPSYVLVPPVTLPPASPVATSQSLPVSTPTPPSSTPEQTEDQSVVVDPADIDWSLFTPVIRVEPPVVAPESSAPAEESAAEPAATADTSSIASSQAADVGIPGEVFPSLPPQGSSLDTSQPASVVPVSVLVHNAHVTVRVQVVDVDSSSIDACNTRVDWGDGTTSGMTTADEVTACMASCNADVDATADATVGINAELLFEHDYAGAIDAEPRVYVASGDGCSYRLAELGLPRIAIVPW